MFWRANIKFMKEILVRMENSFYSHHMTMCWHGGCCDLGLYFLTEYQCQRRILLIRSLTPEIPWKEQNKLCYSLCLNELCKCMWQVNIGGLWRRYPQPPDSAEPRRPGPNEDWTLIIRRIWLPHETSAHTHTHAHTRGHIHTRLHTNAHIHTNTPIHTHRACLITPLFSLWATHRHTHTHTHTGSLTSQGFRCHPVLCRLYTQSLCHLLWVFSALQTAVVGVPVAVVPMETQLIRIRSCMGTWWWLDCIKERNAKL